MLIDTLQKNFTYKLHTVYIQFISCNFSEKILNCNFSEKILNSEISYENS